MTNALSPPPPPAATATAAAAVAATAEPRKSKSAIRVGDEVLHYREGDNAGIVVAVRRPWWAFFGRVHWVQWRDGVLPVPMHNGLRPAAEVRQVEGGEETA